MRDVALSDRAANILDALIREYPGIDEMYRALEWRLCREPTEDAIRISRNQLIYVVVAKSWVNVPRLVVLYRFDDTRVEIISLGVTRVPDAPHP